MDNNKIVVFFGGGALMCSLINALIKNNYKRIFVFTSKRHFNERVEKNNNLKNFLIKKKVNFNVCEKISISEIKKKFNLNQILCISVGSPWIFNQNFIKDINGNIYNIHGSQLPMNRGGGGFTWQILQNDTKGYVSIHKVFSGIDKGDIVFFKKFISKKCKNPLEFQNLYIKVASKLFMKFFSKLLKNKKLKSKKQNENLSSYWPRLNAQLHGWINWDWKAEEIYKFIKGFDTPYIGAHTYINNKVAYLKECSLIKNNKFHPYQSGIIYRKKNKKLFVCAINGTLIFDKILKKNGTPLSDKFIKLGDRFFTPMKNLDRAKQIRVYYNKEFK